MLDTEKVPDLTKDTNKCKDCEYRNIFFLRLILKWRIYLSFQILKNNTFTLSISYSNIFLNIISIPSKLG